MLEDVGLGERLRLGRGLELRQIGLAPRNVGFHPVNVRLDARHQSRPPLDQRNRIRGLRQQEPFRRAVALGTLDLRLDRETVRRALHVGHHGEPGDRAEFHV